VSRLRFTRHAREDLLDIWLYIAPRSSDTVADQVYDRIEQTCQLLKHNPQLGPARPEIAEDARALVIDRWLVEDGVQVVRIVDGVRDLTTIEWTPES
jgi:toxin ParE1/3/4